MSKTINILGDTPKQQWLNAIGIFEMAITANLQGPADYFDVNGGHEDGIEETYASQLGTAKRICNDFADEMRRLVEGVFE